MEEELFELSDIYVDTVGLVTHGAIGEDFFLRKSGGDNMPDEELEVIELESPSFWDRLTKVVTDVIKQNHTEEVKTVEKEEKVEAVVEEPKKDVEKSEPVSEIKTEGGNMTETVEKTQTPAPDFTAVLDEIKKSYNDQLADLRQRLEKAETEANVVKEQTAERDIIQKARQYAALPVRYDDLGKKLYAFSKVVDKESMDWLWSVLEAVDKQLGAAGILNELGTSRSPEELALQDKVEKIAKDEKILYSEAILKLSKSEQEELLAQMRGQ